MKKKLICKIICLVIPVFIYGQDNFISWRESYFTGKPLILKTNIQFIFDDYIIEDKYGLKRVIGPVEKYAENPLKIDTDKPWELNSSTWRGTILRHILFDPTEKLYKGWYLIYRREPGIETGYNYSTLYAESKDGIIWKKPELDFFQFNGLKTNIILHKDDGTALLEDIYLDTLSGNSSQRFVALVKMTPPGDSMRCLVRMFSPDGKRWSFAPDPVLFRGASDGSYSIIYNPDKAIWMLYRRPPTQALVNNKDDGFYVDRNTKRRFSLAISKDMKQWTYPRNIVVLDELDDLPVTQVGNNMDIDWATVIRYQGIYFGFLHLMDNLTISVPRRNHLMWSRDGFDWDRLSQRPCFIENGEPGEWDAGSIGSISVIPAGHQIKIYYSGGNTPQGFYGREGETNIPGFSGTGLAFIGKDRFIGLQAGPEGGFLLTRQFILEGNRIGINFRSGLQNPPPVLGTQIRAELLQPAADHTMALPYPGFSMKDCDVITVNESFYQTISWKGISDLSELKGKPVFIRFYLRNTTLYTFQVKDQQN